ncbi:HNH endonuclease [Alcanivorax sp. MM125-6]|nr:HNH endonuclease [Alcanivorax sp. MM125-6]
MKITTGFGGLWERVNEMGAASREFSYQSINPGEIEIDDQLKRGLTDIDLDEIESVAGLLSYKGRQILLYIPDQGRAIREVLEDPEQGRRFHVAECRTIETMRREGRFERFTITTDLSGTFNISGWDAYSGLVKGNAELKVCRNCLSFLNYKGYRIERSWRQKIAHMFSIDVFFKTYSTQFRHLPNKDTDRSSGYAKNWDQISRRFRADKNWTCEICSVGLEEYPRLLHTHHRDGNKRNNALDNLQALCVDCHRKQYMHESMAVKKADMVQIQKLRRSQGCLDKVKDWQAVLDMADSAYEGVARYVRVDGGSVPEVGADVIGPDHKAILTAELSWPDQKTAIVERDEDREILKAAGWKGLSIEEVLRN